MNSVKPLIIVIASFMFWLIIVAAFYFLSDYPPIVGIAMLVVGGLFFLITFVITLLGSLYK